jgi:hypothetical protein
VGELADAAEGTLEDGAGTPTLDIGNNAHAASVVLMGRVVEALSLGHCVVKGEPRHIGWLEYFTKGLAQEWESS